MALAFRRLSNSALVISLRYSIRLIAIRKTTKFGIEVDSRGDRPFGEPYDLLDAWKFSGGGALCEGLLDRIKGSLLLLLREILIVLRARFGFILHLSTPRCRCRLGISQDRLGLRPLIRRLGQGGCESSRQREPL